MAVLDQPQAEPVLAGRRARQQPGRSQHRARAMGGALGDADAARQFAEAELGCGGEGVEHAERDRDRLQRRLRRPTVAGGGGGAHSTVMCSGSTVTGLSKYSIVGWRAVLLGRGVRATPRRTPPPPQRGSPTGTRRRRSRRPRRAGSACAADPGSFWYAARSISNIVANLVGRHRRVEREADDGNDHGGHGTSPRSPWTNAASGDQRRRSPICPRSSGFERRRNPDEQVLAPVRGDDLHAARQAVVWPAERQARSPAGRSR